MTEPDPDAFGPSLPLIDLCGCPADQGHRCPPPWVDAEEWAAVLALGGEA